MRTVLASLLAASALLAALPARADVQSCIAASEKGQRARSSGKLREARDAFQSCGADACPAMVRRDCVQWQSEVTQALPTVVFGAKDAKGRDLFDVTVTMDGEVIVSKLDGKSIPVDPGPHTFKFDVAGLPSVVEKALVKEGEKSRGMTVSFGGDTGGSPPPPPPPGGDKGGGEKSGGGHTVLPWVVVGLGAATIVTGAVVLLRTPSLPPNCDSSTKVCTKLPTESNEQFAKDQNQAGKHDTQPVLGGVVMGVGGVLLVGGLLWHFLEPTDAKSDAIRVTPWTTTSSAGLSLGGAF